MLAPLKSVWNLHYFFAITNGYSGYFTKFYRLFAGLMISVNCSVLPQMRFGPANE